MKLNTKKNAGTYKMKTGGTVVVASFLSIKLNTDTKSNIEKF